MSQTAFEALREQRIASLNLTVQEFRHRKTGARHLHLATADTNNAFLVAFLTVPENSTGVAHVLEHTSLCGSERFPVRDPFFMMIRRSLNTFMNAFTASDWTAYPFASQNRKDFDNLLQVYLDATFFPRLDPMDFAQEGHRLEFANASDPDAELLRKGVVYNEMKGAMSAAPSQVWRSLRAAVYPTTTYHHNSGGDPSEIAKLSHAALKAFHARHYHPSNALFTTYGSFPVAEHQARIDGLALARFDGQDTGLSIPDEQRYAEPIAIEDHYTLDAAEDPRAKTHVVFGWLLGRGNEPRAMMEAHLLAGVLLEHGASPLRQALETTDLGTTPSELCGLDDEPREMMFAAGLEGSEPERAAAVEELVIGVLERVAREGLPLAQVESVLHQIELSQREVGGGHFPYGLQLVLRVLAPTLHGGDPIAVLDLDPILVELREAIRDPEFIKGLVRRLLLDNPHRVRLTMIPDTELGARRAAEERAELAAIKARLSDAERRRIATQAAQLKARQEQADDPEQLPRVGLEDIPADRPMPEGDREQRDGLALTWYAPATNGLVYQQVVADLPALNEELVDELPLYSACVTEVGCGTRDYLATQTWQSAVTGGIDASASLRTSLTDLQQVRGVFALGGKALVRNAGALDELLLETFSHQRFDELPRLRELIAESRARGEAGVTGHGHVLAMTAACAGMTPCAALAHRWEGLLGLRRLKELDKALAEPEQLAAFAGRLERLREILAAAPRQLLVVG